MMKKESNINITLKTVIKSQKKEAKEENNKKNYKTSIQNNEQIAISTH